MSRDEEESVFHLHNFYRLDDGDLINIWEGEFPRLTKIELNTQLQFKLSGAESDDIKESDDLDSASEDFDDEYNEIIYIKLL